MQSLELVLDFSLYIIWYGFFTLFIFDFLLGLFALIKQSFATPSIQLIQSIKPVNSQLMLPVPDPWTLPMEELELLHQVERCELPAIELLPALKLLASNKTEISKCQKETAKSHTKATKPKLEVLTQPITTSKAVKKDTGKQSTGAKPTQTKLSPIDELQVTKFSFNQVCIEFAQVGLAFERFRTGHYCYRVVFGYKSPTRFKTLQEAMDWLAVNKQSIQAATTN